LKVRVIAMDYTQLFSDEILSEIFPPGRTDAFFAALFGDADEGSFDIILNFAHHDRDAGKLHFELLLKERPGKCLACNLTYGMPAVFARHPIINIGGVVAAIERVIAGRARCGDWQLGNTRTVSNSLHVIPLTITLS
jgi:hypothetical protein